MDVINLDRIIVVSEDIDRTRAEFSEKLDVSFSDVWETHPSDESLKASYGFPGIELVSPKNTEDGEMSRFLEQIGEGIYGVVFRVADLDAADRYLTEREVEPVLDVESDDTRSLFYHPENFSGVFVVLTEYPHPLER